MRTGFAFIDYSAEDIIEPAHPSALCGLCDMPIGEHEPIGLAIAHGCKHMVHSNCLAEAWDQRDADDEGEEDE